MPVADLIHGTVKPGFEPVADAFRANFTDRGEVGAAVCMTVDGEVVVDLWGGYADVETERPWEADTLNVVFSATKGLVATAFLILEDEGRIDLDAPIASLWPELGPHAERIPIRWILNHRSGLVGFEHPITLDDFANDRVPSLLQLESPAWEPGTDQGYHGISYGAYAHEIFRRAAGTTPGTFLRERVTGPLGADVHLPLPESEESRVARLYPSKKRKLLRHVVPRVLFSRSSHEGRTFRDFLRGGHTKRAFGHPKELGATGAGNYDSRLVRSLELCWASAVGSARGLARVYAPLANGGEIDGVRLVSPEAIERVMPRQSWSERDRVLQKPIGFSQGFVKEGTALFSPNPESFGHPGAGGALGWADPVARTSIGYVMNRMDWRIRSPRALALARALYDSLDTPMSPASTGRWG